ncbi:hypothetical protein [Staphylococcus felis]|uniref:hypothetical protein n=1 Tax=Staphylococcus felis TaxID=46127 RepID=UPI001EE814AF|nr:hypothetical protein [Staphylococcus felis]
MSSLVERKVEEMHTAPDVNTVVFQIDEVDDIAQIYNQHRLTSLSGLTVITP